MRQACDTWLGTDPKLALGHTPNWLLGLDVTSQRAGVAAGSGVNDDGSAIVFSF